MVLRNKNIAKLQAGYLFPEINRRKNKLLEENPDAKIISLGIGNTTKPLTPYITKALKEAAESLGTAEGYSGYGDEQGMTALREKIAEQLYKGLVDANEVFVSDGGKCDCGRLQLMFGSKVTIAVQDPAYPVYVDGSVIIGVTGDYNESIKRFDNIVYMKCTAENNFFPDIKSLERTDLIYFCSPNNPTGVVATRDQLKELVDFAKANKSIIIFDAAYSEFISDPNLPRSIFEIEGVREVALEVSSFSKSIGFTGVRLGWTVVPKELRFDNGEQVINDWNRITCTVFNGASNIVQKGCLAVLDKEGLKEMQETVDFYMENARLIKKGLDEMGVKSYWTGNSPYIWAYFPGEKSWDVFSRLLNEAHVVVTPGSGFGSAGEEYVRFSAFGHRNLIIEAVERLKEKLK
ncbi:MAG: LL-diaminopimelate aminotransferase [Nanoarchaeota archaeon]|nr:LL-diaminopimelate aminotransferase [Nanoarchaeota archaeon]MBU1855235.1 LL-diaminopimelate aminotransferase [Nanoarchaeota archaeon]